MRSGWHLPVQLMGIPLPSIPVGQCRQCKLPFLNRQREHLLFLCSYHGGA